MHTVCLSLGLNSKHTSLLSFPPFIYDTINSPTMRKLRFKNVYMFIVSKEGLDRPRVDKSVMALRDIRLINNAF